MPHASNDNEIGKSDQIPGLVKWIYAIVLFGAAVLIYLMFEKTVSISIYIIYLALGIILGMGVVIVLHLLWKNRSMQS